jgi:4-amino-4-deoxy-L-arabinose transferase-like glycosyltransferase
VVANYPPLYVLAQTPWVRVFGPAFWYGRLLSFVCVIASALLIAGLLRALTGRTLPAAIGSLVMLCVPYVAFWAPLYRVDALALALSLGALYVIVRRPEGASAPWLCAALLTAAVFTRQSYALAAPLAAVAWLASRPGGRRRAVGLLLLVVTTGGILALALDLLSGGGFTFHTVTANINEYRPARLVYFLRELVVYLPAFVSVLAIYLVAGRRLDGRVWRFVAPYSVGALLAALTIGKVGSNVNYFLELCVALGLAAGAAFAGVRSRPWLRSALALALLLQVSLLLGGTRYRQHLDAKLDRRPGLDRLMQLVRTTDGTILADETLGLLPLDGRPVHFQPFELTQLARRGAWDPQPFLEELERRSFSAVLVDRLPWSPVHRTRWTPEMLERLEQGYRRVGVVGHTEVYRPHDL